MPSVSPLAVRGNDPSGQPFKGAMTLGHRRQVPEILITEVLHSIDSRCRLPGFEATRRKEIEDILAKETWRVVLRDEVPNEANILGARFVLALKDVEKAEPVFKDRLFRQGHRDREMAALFHDSTNMNQTSIKALTAIAAVFRYDVWKTYISQAYLESRMRLLADVYILPSKEFNLPPDVRLRLLRPPYGVPDTGNYFHTVFPSHMTTPFGMSQTFGDLAVFFRHVRGERI